MRRPVDDKAAQPLPDDTAVTGKEEPVEQPRVLIVDDDERNLLAIANVLEDIGELVVARSGEEALRHLLKGEFAVILLDVYMPGMDGYETAQIIRSREQTKGIPIIFLSAVNKETEHLIRGYSMGAVDYVFKPVEPIVLRSKVAVFVDLFAKTREIERKARQEQALLDANLRANAERLKAEQELRRAEQRQAAIIQSLPIVLYLEPFDVEPRCPAFVSGKLEEIAGFSLDQVRDEPGLWQSRLHPDDRDRVLAALELRKATGRFSVEYRWQCADGTYKHFHDQAVLLKDGRGPPEFAGTLTDISEQRSLESQLVQAQKMDAIGKLTGGIAHDFNNLLAAVIGGLGLLERRASLTGEQQEILSMTQRAAEQGTELVRRLLAFARKQELKPGSVDVSALEGAVSQLLAHTLGGLVQLEWRRAADAWPVFVDEAQLELALVNLIINARDAMPAGGTILISMENRAVAADEVVGLVRGDYVLLTVSDTGTGIAPEVLEKVMEPFFTTKDVGKGTGLGLSMVYGFAKQSNGAVHIQSELGRGTKVELWLPRAIDVAPNTRPPEKERPERPERGLQVMIVDDHEGVRRTTAEMLQEDGHGVVEAVNGSDALLLLEDGACDCELVITDYAMPDLSGTEFIRRAREMRPGLPCILITGYADADAVGERPDDVVLLSKPFSPHQLASAIASAAAVGA